MRIRPFLRALARDAADLLSGRGDPGLPPHRLRYFVGPGDFRAVGDELLRLLVGTGGLGPSDAVLDIGCGIGRVALPLTRYLTPNARYDGFDVSAPSIRWCRRAIAARHANFRFHHVRVGNAEYATRGAPAAEFRFPFEDASFDFAFATSLFTHLMRDGAQRYLAETARVLRPGGVLLATFYLFEDGIVLPRELAFGHAVEGVRVLTPDNPELGVAFAPNDLLAMLSNAGFEDLRVERGAWTGRTDAPTFQDVIVARTSARQSSSQSAIRVASSSSCPLKP